MCKLEDAALSECYSSMKDGWGRKVFHLPKQHLLDSGQLKRAFDELAIAVRNQERPCFKLKLW